MNDLYILLAIVGGSFGMLLTALFILYRKHKSFMIEQEKKGMDEHIDEVKEQDVVDKHNNVTSKATPELIDSVDTGYTWIVASASVPGIKHTSKTPPIPCQDNHAHAPLDNGWGIAVVCDGAGSSSHSDIGSNFVAKEILRKYQTVLPDLEWFSNGQSPERDAWADLSKSIFVDIKEKLSVHATELELELNSLATTVIVVIYSPNILMSAHIGDGRAGYLNGNDEWKSCMRPHNGDESNITIFLTSDGWEEGDATMKDVPVPESLIIEEKSGIRAFTLLSDGCENHVFETGVFDAEKEIFTPKNNPFPGFYNPNVEILKRMYGDKLDPTIIQEKWAQFLTNGNNGFIYEPDDKTLILGVLNDNILE